MILTTHALVGAAIGKYVSNPIALITILIPLHYTMDIFRHGEYLGKKATFKNTWWKVTFDLFGGISIILLTMGIQETNAAVFFSIMLGAFISMFPDLLTVLYWKLDFKFLGKIYRLHQFVHRFPDGSPERAWTFRNAVNDIIFSIVATIFLLIL